MWPSRWMHRKSVRILIMVAGAVLLAQPSRQGAPPGEAARPVQSPSRT
ncbi:MAG TPA: hypothetical protein VG142_03130 [Trebonia sp.]|nr:hypothetical protein [Trebonia sp.]